MADTAALYLTKEEVDRLFTKFPVSIQKKWQKKLRIENIGAFETEKQLAERMQKPWRDASPELRKFGEHVGKILQEGKGFTAIDMKQFPDTAFPHYFFSIGACGMSALIQIALQSKVKNSDMEAIAGLTFVRHVILEANSLTTAK